MCPHFHTSLREDDRGPPVLGDPCVYEPLRAWTENLHQHGEIAVFFFLSVIHEEPLIEALANLIFVAFDHDRSDRSLVGILAVLQLIDYIVVGVFTCAAVKKKTERKKEEKTFHGFYPTLSGMKKIAIIDPFMVSPSIHCFNHLVTQLPAQLTYHQPHRLGYETLHSQSPDGFIVLGSASNVTENEAWHRELSEYLLTQLEHRRAVLGICFGHQLMAKAFEAEVNFIKPDQEKLKGTRVVTFLEDFGRIRKGTELKLALTHQQMVKELPAHLVEVARGLPHDIIRHRTLPFIGIQPHPEGSKHFCLNNALVDGEELVQQAQSDGLRFVREWLETF